MSDCKKTQRIKIQLKPIKPGVVHIKGQKEDQNRKG